MGEDIKENILEMVSCVVERTINAFTGGSIYPEEWDLKTC